ncbi:MAG: SLBB domain-containing protein, partial [Deltaproteobacteria bacterium]|nr:SLBB domain-containing protein [Deltaproteobacteria bacterium]
FKSLIGLLVFLFAACAGRTNPESMENVKEGDLQDLLNAENNSGINKDDLKVDHVSTTLPTQEDIYRIGPNDVLNIIVLNHEELSSPRDFNKGIVGTIVKKDGYIYVPIIGRVKAEGYTIPEFIDIFKEHLANYILEPEISVDILQYKSKKFYVLGAVRKPGVFPVDGNTTLLEGIALAGGVPPEGNLERAYIIRNNTLLPINIADILLRGDTSRNIYMNDQDLIYIPSSADQTVYVLGEVKEPGAIKIISNRLSLGQAIAEAGGLNPVQAKKNKIRVIRGSWQEPTIYTIKYDAVLVYGDQIWLQPGDRIFIEPTGLTTLSRYMLQILPFLIGLDHATSVYDRVKP